MKLVIWLKKKKANYYSMIDIKEVTHLAQWGLEIEKIEDLGEKLYKYWQKFSPYMQSQTRDTSIYGFQYISGLLRIESKKTINNIGQKTKVPTQNMQHFISNSPWSSQELLNALQRDISSQPRFQKGGMLVIDESANEKSGKHSAGAGRQYNGRLGKIEMSQVGVFISLVTPTVNTWIDGKLFFPKAWFKKEAAEERQKIEMPARLSFKTKPELAWEIVQRIRDNGVAFEGIAMDTLYGRNRKLRANLDQTGIEYYADVPNDTQVYLRQPHIIYPRTKKGKKSKRPLFLCGSPCKVRDLLKTPYLRWHQIDIRPSEQGFLTAEFARIRVWTRYNNSIRSEWLLIRLDNSRVTFILSNASLDTSLDTMAWRKSHRYFIERSNQDAKSEFGWDDFRAIKYRAWQHQLALTILASVFVAEIRLDWATQYQHHPELLAHYQIDILPILSVANICELLRAAMPLPQLTPPEAALLVIDHLVNRIYSRKSRLNSGPSP